MPRLKRLMFHIPISSPHSMRMLGLSVLAISISFDPVTHFCTTSRLAYPPRRYLHETQQYGTEGKHADQDEGKRDRIKRRLNSLSCHPRDLSETSAPQVTNRPMILPSRNDKGQDATGNQCKSQVSR